MASLIESWVEVEMCDIRDWSEIGESKDGSDWDEDSFEEEDEDLAGGLVVLDGELAALRAEAKIAAARAEWEDNDDDEVDFLGPISWIEMSVSWDSPIRSVVLHLEFLLLLLSPETSLIATLD